MGWWKGPWDTLQKEPRVVTISSCLSECFVGLWGDEDRTLAWGLLVTGPQRLSHDSTLPGLSRSCEGCQFALRSPLVKPTPACISPPPKKKEPSPAFQMEILGEKGQSLVTSVLSHEQTPNTKLKSRITKRKWV